MLTATKTVGLAALLLLSAGFALSLRQGSSTDPGGGPDSVSPSPSMPPEEAVYIQGALRIEECCKEGVGVLTEADGVRQRLRGELWTGTSTMNDPRLSGTFTFPLNVDEYPQPASAVRVEIGWGSIRIENENGAWVGSFSSTLDSKASPEKSLVLYELTGEGAYEGLSVMLFENGHYTTFPDFPVAGAIFPGDLPPNR